jgi:hypothetical protein
MLDRELLGGALWKKYMKLLKNIMEENEDVSRDDGGRKHL